MQEVLDTARLVDAGAVAGRGIAATVPRSEIEDVLRSEDGSPELVLDLVRGGAGDVGDAVHDAADERRPVDRHGHQLAHVRRARARVVREAVQGRSCNRAAGAESRRDVEAMPTRCYDDDADVITLPTRYYDDDADAITLPTRC